ncbi:restriction endonuclease [Flavobacterium sp.]|uniref:McrC family protein n=1 Tax=Flavobacterium sp. TaxID=239 RepID=UPI00248A7304|nr:restriction endonuclease [Flavobacterium sp.]MDI1316896.1 restriction endonuclease [Flavobacterium sp.]
MRINKPIQVFEYKTLTINSNGFKENHWKALGWYNEKHGGNFFTLTPNGVRFNQYVGVIQVGDLTIEVLPKIGQAAEDKDKVKWRNILIDMLRECRWMNVYTHEKANLNFKPNSILEVYLELFINECEKILRIGLIKKYRFEEANCKALKGKLLFNKQIQKNLVHQENFYTKHQEYDRENEFNQILFKALKLIPNISSSPFLKDKVSSLILSFPDLQDIQVNEELFARLNYNRKNNHYKEAIEIAAMLLLNFRPDISSGKNHVLAILFDMNSLWEEYVYRQLFKGKHKDWSLKVQNSKPFWRLSNSVRKKSIRPDIVIEHKISKCTAIIDTKWKLPDNNIPSDNDLKQMFVYNEYWSGKNAILLYPKSEYQEEPIYIKGNFTDKPGNIKAHECGLMKISVLDSTNSKLDNKMGIRLNKYLEENILI